MNIFSHYWIFFKDLIFISCLVYNLRAVQDFSNLFREFDVLSIDTAMNIHVHKFTSLIVSSGKKVFVPIAQLPLRTTLLFYPSTSSNRRVVFFLSPHQHWPLQI